MTTDIQTKSPDSPAGVMKSPAVHLLLLSCAVGAAVGVLFIVVQPLFGMDTLTSRHAAAYQNMGSWSATPALILAWLAHLLVSVFYGLISGLVFVKYQRLGVIALFTLAFSWVTTVIAPPANALIMQLVSFQQIRPEGLPALNFSLDAKFVLHLGFFVVIVAALYIYTNTQKPSDAPVSRL